MDDLKKRYWYLKAVVKHLDTRPAIPVFYDQGGEEKSVHIMPDQVFKHPDGDIKISYDELLNSRQSSLYAEIDILIDEIMIQKSLDSDINEVLADYNANRAKLTMGSLIVDKVDNDDAVGGPEQKETFVFFEGDRFYPIELFRSAVEARVVLSPGTTKVETLDHKVVWQKKAPPAGS